jgi:hypothetical protein
MIDYKRLNLLTLITKAPPKLLQSFLKIHGILNDIACFEAWKERIKPKEYKAIACQTIEDNLSKSWLLYLDCSLICAATNGVLAWDKLGTFVKLQSDNQAKFESICIEECLYIRMLSLVLHYPDTVRLYFRLNLYKLKDNKSYRCIRRDYSENSLSVVAFDDVSQVKRLLEEGFQEVLKAIQLQGSMPYFDCHLVGDNLHISAITADHQKAIEFMEKDTVQSGMIKPPLYFGVVFNTQQNTVEVFGKSRSFQSAVHQTVGKVIYNNPDVPDDPPENHVFDVQTMFENLMKNQRIIMLPDADSKIITIAPYKVRFNRLHFPYSQVVVSVYPEHLDEHDQGNLLFLSLKDHYQTLFSTHCKCCVKVIASQRRSNP